MSLLKKMSPSMMCCNIYDIEKNVKVFEDYKIEMLHIDVMDGHFVPNITLGTSYANDLKRMTNIPLDVHLMVEDPQDLIPLFNVGEGDYVSVHYESTKHIIKALQMIKDKGANALLALNPGTPISSAEETLQYIDGVLLMTVKPGFSGQKMVDGAIEKIKKMRDYLDLSGCENKEIQVDGNVSFTNGELMSKAGANIFVAGTSSVFSKDRTLQDSISEFRKCINCWELK